MDEKAFIWTSELTKKLFKLRFENDWLFRKKKQPWGEFYKILLENGFPPEMTINHVRKKWSYTYDMYKIAKKTNNKDWKYYKVFDKHFGKSKILDKYESSFYDLIHQLLSGRMRPDNNRIFIVSHFPGLDRLIGGDEWRLKLITCISEATSHKLDVQTMWKTVERVLRSQNLPNDCCVQDIKGLWQHIRMTFNRKHRLKIKNGADMTEWPLYNMMVKYFETYEPDYIVKLENETTVEFARRLRPRFSRKKRKDIDDNENESDFQWSKDITETFIQLRMQNDWIFIQKKYSWNALLKIMVGEYGFPVTLTSREISRKWAATFAEYQKAKATNNKSWVYYTLFEAYLGEGTHLSLNPLVNWQEQWVHHLISIRIDLEHLFKFSLKDQTGGWREVEKRLRSIGLPLDHSLLDLPEIWTHLQKTFRWKNKFANKGILNEQWPYYDALARYMESQSSQPKRPRIKEFDDGDTDEPALNDDCEDDMKLLDLKQRWSLQPKFETDLHCRSCYSEQATVNIFEEVDGDGLDLACKLRAIGSIEIDKSDNLPSQICLDCLQELQNAYNFRRKCQYVDKHLRSHTLNSIKIEIPEKVEENQENQDQNNIDDAREKLDHNDFVEMDIHYEEDVPDAPQIKTDSKPTGLKKQSSKVIRSPKVIRKKKKVRKSRYDYWKVCEVCGKHTRNLVSHLDMHSTGKPYSCTVCDKRFKFKSGLVIHKAVHNPTPRKTCEVCGKTFHVLAQYRRHFVYHANERKYACETCGKRFNTIDILRVHNRIHTDERPFSCQECGKTFRTAGCVGRHKRIVHRNLKVQ